MFYKTEKEIVKIQKRTFTRVQVVKCDKTLLPQTNNDLYGNNICEIETYLNSQEWLHWILCIFCEISIRLQEINLFSFIEFYY